MNHLNPTFQRFSQEQIEGLISHFPLAEIITSTKDNILVSEIPLLKRKNKLIGHIANQNPQLEHFKQGQPLKVVFMGPQAYISPKLFDNLELPTFNFVRLHIDGEIQLKQTPKMLKDIKELYRSLDKSTVDIFDSQKDKINRLSHYITGFNIEINTIDVRFKLSQDKTVTHQNIALETLSQASQQAIANYCGDYLKPFLLNS